VQQFDKMSFSSVKPRCARLWGIGAIGLTLPLLFDQAVRARRIMGKSAIWRIWEGIGLTSMACACFVLLDHLSLRPSCLSLQNTLKKLLDI